MRLFPRSGPARVSLAIAVTAALAVSTAAVAQAATKNVNQYSNPRAHACYDKQTGALRLVNATRACKPNEKRVIWDRVAKQGAKGATGARGLQGLVGPQGPQGIQGAPGAASTVEGPQGIQGVQGEKGDTGATGPSLYEYAVAHDYPGTYEDFLGLLKGATGDQGEKGEQGIQGAPGENGQQGIQGEKGDKGATGDQGEKGDKGDKGDAGTNGASWIVTQPTINGSGTDYTGLGTALTSGTESSAAITAPGNGSISGFSVRTGSSNTRTLIVTLYKDGQSTGLTCTVPSGNNAAARTCTASGTAVSFTSANTVSFAVTEQQIQGSNSNWHSNVRISTAIGA